MGGRVAVIGDVAGHLDELRGELVRLGADADTLDLPADLTVVQVGDLVHRGPDSPGVVALVDRYLRTGQWVQLVGNHEAQYLREPAFDWPERLPDDTVRTLRSWWASGALRAAVSIDDRFLVTHAGLTEGYWRLALDAPASPALAARALNSFIGTHEDVLFAPGQMLGGGSANMSAGPVWASAGLEVIPSWLDSGTTMPFDVVHGHSSVADWRGRRFTVGRRIGELMSVDDQRAHAIATLPAGGRVIGIDPGHARRPYRPWQAFVVDDATVQPDH